MYYKTLVFMVGSINIYGGIYYKVKLLTCITIPPTPPFKAWCYGIMAIL